MPHQGLNHRLAENGGLWRMRDSVVPLRRPHIERLLRDRFEQVTATLLTKGEKDVPKWVYVFQKKR